MKKVDLSTFSNPEYNPGNPIKRAVWYLVNLVFFSSGWFPFYGPKRSILRLFGASIGKNVVIKPYVKIKHPWYLEIGENTWIGEHVWIDNLSKVNIGNNCCISQGALLITGNHNYKSSSFDLMTRPIQIEDGVWIGAKSAVTGGVTCAQHSVLTVGSVASNNLEAYGIYKGNPCSLIKKRIIED